MKILNYMLFALATLFLSSCFKDYNERYMLTEQFIEFEDAVPNSKLSGKIYPLLSVVGPESGIVKYQVNLSGVQPSQDEVLNFRVIDTETTAVEGVHYRLPRGTSFVVPAGSSFGYVEVEVLETGSGSTRLVLELLGNETVKVSANYRAIGIPIVYRYIVPDPATVEEINDIVHYKEVTIGSYTNTAIGSFASLSNGYVYNLTGATVSPELMDIVYHNSASSAGNIMFPGTPSLSGWPNTYNVVAEWPVKNIGQLIKFHDVTPDEQLLFDQIQNTTDLENAWNYAVANISAKPGYSATNNGPANRIRQLAANELVFISIPSKNLYAVFQVKEYVAGNAGTITVAIKTKK